ncbi:nuclease-related domain-containing protein [Rheinheimera maricola]|uniref:NERD domain-containing protein n=1 Tax=Rheinheimera maricola TaxID=2793282 RepID=A0ABS7X6Z6_9GAMM|nr:nuclease-related domain-containing protein [Rheinheimera maricola]MBZ9611314.1 NERD domain-containing protein [Rheinheimera maricola]
MRGLLLSLLLFILGSPMVYGQQQYTEGACILLQQQIARFSHQKQNSNYRSATREYDRFCRKPAKPPQRQIAAKDQAVGAKPVETTTALDAVLPIPEVQTTADVAGVDTTVDAEASVKLVADEVASAASTVSTAPEPVSAQIASTQTGSVANNTDSLSQVSDTGLRLSVSTADNAMSSGGFTGVEYVLTTMLNNMPLIIANIFALLLAVFLLTSWFGLNLPGFKGVFAEYKLNRLLHWRLPAQYQHFRKLKLLTKKDELIVVDHLVLSPYGIFVIAVKSNRGRISGNETQANWTRHYFGSSKQLMNPLHQNFKNVEAVKHWLELKDSDAAQWLHSVAAFSRVAQFEAGMPANVTYVDAVSGYIKQFSEPCLTNEQLNRFSALLSMASSEH